ncbi:MAG: Gfo/Idh/MocA family oxidoreductase [Proteobacteria bacterium]|nr:Gfo/Idh/MocA family oxidoreductase [Pseudomonadota bacterium]
MLKIALIGAGEWCEGIHAPALAHYAKEHPGEVDLAAVCVRRRVERAKLFCEKFGFKTYYTDIEEMVDKEKPDACWVVTAIEATRGVAGKVMELGVPVLFEKPPGKNLQEAKELAEISKRTGTPNMVAFNRRWAPCMLKALGWAKEHGPFEYLYARMLRSKRMDETFAYGTGIHLLDCVRALADAALGGVKSAETNRVDSAAGRFNFHVDLQFGSGAGGRCDILPTCGVVEETYTLFGNNRWITFYLPWHTVDGRAELWVEGKLVESESWPAQPAWLSSGFYGEASEFIAALTEGRRPSPSAEESVDSVVLAEAVQAGSNISFE